VPPREAAEEEEEKEEEDSASDKALEVKGSFVQELSEGPCFSLHCFVQERASHPSLPLPRGGERRSMSGNNEGTRQNPL